MLRLFSLILAIAIPTIASSQQAFITFLHNSADPALGVVDVYVTQSGQTTKVDNLQFQKADNFNTAIVFGGFECFVDVAPSTSSSKDEAIATLTFTPQADAGYEIEFHGVKGDGFAANPEGGNIQLTIKANLVPIVTPVVGEVSAIISHGATDLEACDVYVRGNSKAIATNIAFGNFSSEIKQLKRQRQTIDLTKTGDKTKVLASFEVDLSTVSSDIIVLTISGFKTPADNHESTNELALLTVLEDGNVIKSPILSGSQKARVQFIHNSADSKLATVDIYINGVRAIDNIAFKRATAFADFDAGSAMQVVIARSTSTSVKDSLASVTIEQFRPGRAYHLILHGVLDTALYSGHGTAGYIGITVLEKEAALEKGSKANETSVRAVNGVIDLQPVDLVVGATTLGSNMNYNSVVPEYINLTGSQADTIWALQAGTSTKLRGWIADLRGSERAVVVALAGVVGPDSNQNAEAYELILIDANGTVNDRLVAVDPVASVTELVPSSSWTMSPNPTSLSATLSIPLDRRVAGIIGQGALARVVSVTGTAVAEFPLMLDGNSMHGVLNTAALPVGMYQVFVKGMSDIFVGSTTLGVLR